MGEAEAVEFHKHLLDGTIDPRLRPVGRRFRAQGDDIGEGAVGGHAEAVGGDHLSQGAGQVEAVERQDGAAAWFHPIDASRIARVRHGEHAHGIGTQHHRGIERVVKKPAHAGDGREWAGTVMAES